MHIDKHILHPKYANRDLAKREQLDAILEIFDSRKFAVYLTSLTIRAIIKENNIRIDEQDIDAILLHLTDEGHISNDKNWLTRRAYTIYANDGAALKGMLDVLKNATQPLLFLTFNGSIFYNDEGGYHQRYLNSQSEKGIASALKSQIEKREVEMLGIQADMRKWTRWAAIFALLILIVEFFLLVVAFLVIIFDHPESFPWFWKD